MGMDHLLYFNYISSHVWRIFAKNYVKCIGLSTVSKYIYCNFNVFIYNILTNIYPASVFFYNFGSRSMINSFFSSLLLTIPISLWYDSFIIFKNNDAADHANCGLNIFKLLFIDFSTKQSISATIFKIQLA